VTRILVFAGSARKKSYNKMLAAAAAAKVNEAGGAATLVDLADYEMPLYDGDLQERDGIPPGAVALRGLMLEHPGLLIACPEYNGSITPLLKNAIDWISRKDGDIPMLAAFQGKIAGLLSASPSGFGGMRGLVHVRAILSGIGVHVVPKDVSVPGAHQAFAPDGSLVDPKLDERLTAAVRTLVETTAKLSG
jgi:NAD(P)H-dependent FMN reductase